MDTELREAVLKIIWARDGERIPIEIINQKADELVALIAQHDQARLTAILAKACNYETYSKGHVSYEDAVPVAAITAAFEAVV